MKKLTLLLLTFIIFAGISSLKAQINDPNNAFKKHLNSVVEKVENTESAAEKRTILNKSFDDITEAIEKVEKMNSVSESDKEGLAGFKESIQEKKDELNGMNGFSRVKNGQLNSYAKYVMQDFEQADKTVTFSLTTLLLIILILILI